MGSKKPLVIGIAGVSGSGKTAISKKLTNKLNAIIVHLDDYWKYYGVEIPSRRHWRKWEHPSSINFDELVKRILKLKNKTINNKKYIIVEGFCIFYSPKIRKLLDLKIFITLPDSLVVKRRLKKFGVEDDQEKYSRDFVVKAYKRYGEPTKKYADLILSGKKEINENIKKILEYVKKLT